jgi:hypothetical protein
MPAPGKRLIDMMHMYRTIAMTETVGFDAIEKRTGEW